jgi:hypothetical protein
LSNPWHLGRHELFIRRHRRAVTAGVVIASIATCVALSGAAGWSATSARLQHMLWWLLPLILLAHLIAYTGYVVAHHYVINHLRPEPVSWRRGAHLVALGFGAWLIRGGFVLDRRALEWYGSSPTDAGLSAMALGTLELALLAPAAWLCALLLLGARGVPLSNTVPWVVGVPVGLLLGIAVIVASPRMNGPSGVSKGARSLAAGGATVLAILRRCQWP